MFSKKMDQFTEEYCRLFPFYGSLRITRNDEILYQRHMGYADQERELSIQENTLFNFYSLTKPFCALGLLKLKDQGFVDIDAHPGVYVPEAKGYDSRLTIRQLLHHVSGLPDFLQTESFARKYAPGTPDKVRDHLTLLQKYPMNFEPGTGALYSNINFTLCALILENVTGMLYADYMKTEVFKPLGMKTAQIDFDNLTLANRAQGYELDGAKLVRADRTLDWMLGGGDMLGTVDDVYCLNRAIKQQLLLSPETWKEVLSPSPLNSMGMGCTILNWNGKECIKHNGGYTGFRTLHIQFPEDDFDIILLSNCGFGDARNAFSYAAFAAYYGLDAVANST